jgi:hypothetical protein
MAACCGGSSTFSSLVGSCGSGRITVSGKSGDTKFALADDHNMLDFQSINLPLYNLKLLLRVFAQCLKTS